MINAAATASELVLRIRVPLVQRLAQPYMRRLEPVQTAVAYRAMALADVMSITKWSITFIACCSKGGILFRPAGAGRPLPQPAAGLSASGH